jgi:hypothetical protein
MFLEICRVCHVWLGKKPRAVHDEEPLMTSDMHESANCLLPKYYILFLK